MRLIIILLPALVLAYLWYRRSQVMRESQAAQQAPEPQKVGADAFPLPPIRSAREVLDRRYAEGEISREDYLRIRDDIVQDTGEQGSDEDGTR